MENDHPFQEQVLKKKIPRLEGRVPHGVMVKAVDCRSVVSEFEFQSCYAIMFPFKQIPLGKVWTSLSSQLWVKKYHYRPADLA